MRTFLLIESWILVSWSRTLPLEALLIDCWPRMLSSSVRSSLRRSLPGPPFWLSAILSLTAFCGRWGRRRGRGHEASRCSRGEPERTHQLRLDGVDLGLYFVLLRVVDGLVRLACAVRRGRELLDVGRGGAGGAGGRRRLGLFGRAVRGGGLGLGCHLRGERGARGDEGKEGRWWASGRSVSGA